ncbi:hypothetical protein CDL12_18755 [Handroanthus impetiginosus]|uniref:Uncharacterized protein n=1 Tax=Handroanthus impetiginosus TaxID=429701 RepID=A0A2G9GTR1_9LAMI|nr:hypothetical protein CDL12_18755 [Handroanthus impetiginosus]
MKILCSPSFRSTRGHEIWCMNTTVMFEVLGLLEKRSKKRTIKIDEFSGFIAEMRSSPQGMLEELTMDVMNKARFIIISLHSHEHWFLLIFDTLEKKFIQINSLWSPQTKGTTKIFIPPLFIAI